MSGRCPRCSQRTADVGWGHVCPVLASLTKSPIKSLDRTELLQRIATLEAERDAAIAVVVDVRDTLDGPSMTYRDMSRSCGCQACWSAKRIRDLRSRVGDFLAGLSGQVKP